MVAIPVVFVRFSFFVKKVLFKESPHPVFAGDKKKAAVRRESSAAQQPLLKKMTFIYN